jgi:integrase
MGVKVKERNGAWWIFVNHHKRRKAKRIGVGESGKKAAKEVARQIQARLALGHDVFVEDTKVSTVAEYSDAWLRNYAAVEVKPRTHELYETMFRLHILPTLGHVRLDRLQRGPIQELIAVKSEAGFSRSTLRNILAPFREMLNHAVEDRIIPSNPAARIGKRLSRLKNDKEGQRVEIFTESELKHLLATADQGCPHADAIYTAAWSGMREGELLGLQWPDVDFRNGFAEVRRTIAYRKGRLLVGSPKSGKARRVDLPQVLLIRLKGRLDNAIEMAALSGQPFHDWVFPNRAGLPIDASHFINRTWHPLLRKAQLRRVKFHSVRHTYASLLIMRGENLKYISEQLGHSSIKVTTDLYGHLIPGFHRGAVDAFAAATT